MKVDRVRALLRRECEAAGSMRAWCRAHRVSLTYVCEVLAGRVEPGWKIYDTLGLDRVVTYQRRKDAT